MQKKGDFFMKKRKYFLGVFSLLLVLALMTGCGMRGDKNTESGHRTDGTNFSVGGSPDTSTTTESTAAKDHNNNNSNRVGDAADDVGNAAGDVAEGVGDAAGDVIKGAGEAVDDVADGIGDAVDNLGGGSFDNYEDAKSYLLDRLHKDNAGAHYEVRKETKDLTAYNHSDAGAEGYKFHVYETDGGEKIGIYYVDKTTGKIYRYMGKNSIEGY